MGFGVFGFGGLFGLNLWSWFLDCVCGGWCYDYRLVDSCMFIMVLVIWSADLGVFGVGWDFCVCV